MITHAETFIRHPLRAEGHEREIRGLIFPHGNERRIEVSLVRRGERIGRLQIGADGAELLTKALDRLDFAKESIGTFNDGRFDVEVSVGPHQAGRAIYLQKRDAAGVPAGHPVALYGEEIGALAEGIAWLWGTS
jgi:hypothetical protein